MKAITHQSSFFRFFGILGLMCFMLYQPARLIAQNYQLSIASADGCLGEPMILAIEVDSFDNLGAISLFLEYPPDSLIFDSIANIHADLASILFNDVEDAQGNKIGKLAFSWSAFNPVDLGTSHIFDLCFTHQGFAVSINVLEDSEFTDFNAQIWPVVYTDGSIHLSSIPLILSQPHSHVETSEVLSLAIGAMNIDNYQWQIWQNDAWIDLLDGGGFYGSQLAELEIRPDEIGAILLLLRCKLMACSIIYSDEFEVVLSLNSPEDDEKDPSFRLINTLTSNEPVILIITYSGNAVCNIYNNTGELLQSRIFSNQIELNSLIPEIGIYHLLAYTLQKPEHFFSKTILIHP